MLFKREIKLHLGDTLISGLDASFHIEKTLTGEPNTAEIKVWNMSRENRDLLRERTVPVTLLAGYVGAVGQLFKGDILGAFSEKQGPDWITTLQTGDGANAIQGARINKSFKAGTLLSDILADVARALGISVGDALSKLQELSPSQRLSRGTAISGSASTEIHKLCALLGLEASIQDKSLQILQKGFPVQKTMVILSPQSGLLGSPSIGPGGVLKAKALLNHDIFPGRLVRIKSQLIDSRFFRVERANYTGDIAGPDWYVEIEGRAQK